MAIDSYTLTSPVDPVLTKEVVVRQGDKRGWDIVFKPSFGNRDNMINVFDKLLLEFLILGLKGLGVGVKGGYDSKHGK